MSKKHALLRATITVEYEVDLDLYARGNGMDPEDPALAQRVAEFESTMLEEQGDYIFMLLEGAEETSQRVEVVL